MTIDMSALDYYLDNAKNDQNQSRQSEWLVSAHKELRTLWDDPATTQEDKAALKVRAAEIYRLFGIDPDKKPSWAQPQPTSQKYVDVVFDGPPAAESGRFVECEDESGRSVNAGEWIDRGNGLWALRIRIGK